ncbi:MAG: hypothetical protein ABUL58_06505 [Steroidobacter sp.]
MSEAIQTEPVKAESGAAIISKRALHRLAEMQHALAAEMRILSERHSRFLGALMACDIATQQAMMMEYRDQLHSVHAIIAKLRMVLERFSDDRD